MEEEGFGRIALLIRDLFGGLFKGGWITYLKFRLHFYHQMEGGLLIFKLTLG